MPKNEDQPRASELLIYGGRIYHLDLAAGEVSPLIFLSGDPARIDEIARHFEGPIFRRTHREFVTITGTYEGVLMTAIGTGIGPDNIEITLVELYAILEYLQTLIWTTTEIQPIIIRLGTSGCPQDSIPCGSLAISSYAAGLDNTGLFYLEKAIEHYLQGNFEEIFYTGDAMSREIWLAYKKEFVDIFPMPVIIPYVSQATPDVVQALETECRRLNLPSFTGITTSASGFFANQGRRIGPKLDNILFPGMQEKIAAIKIINTKQGIEIIIAVDNEMESSAMFRICHILGYKCGTICLVLANRKEGDKLEMDDYKQGVENCIQVGLEAMYRLATKK